MKVAVYKALRDEQAGIRKSRYCISQIATLRIIIEQTIEWSSLLYLLFVDFEKAFDSLNREAMWRIFVIMAYLIKSSICLRFSITALLAKCFME